MEGASLERCQLLNRGDKFVAIGEMSWNGFELGEEDLGEEPGDLAGRAVDIGNDGTNFEGWTVFVGFDEVVEFGDI